MSHAIVMCIEKGSLEYKGLCLLVTLRRNWGRFKDVPIYIYSPRRGKEVSPWLTEAFKKLGAVHITIPLNEKYADYPLANKPLSMAHAEKNVECDYLIFLDSDILCWSEPILFTLPDGKDLAMTVDTTKAVASAGPDDPFDRVWMDLYQKAQAEHFPYVTTSLTNERVRGWWGSGVIVTRRSAGLMSRWHDLFESALETTPFFPEMTYLREQMIICALAASVWPRFQELPIAYNYQVQNYDHFSEGGFPPQDAVLWHYQPFFNKVFRKFGERLDQISDVQKKITAANNFSNELHVRYKKMISLDVNWLEATRKTLKIGPRLKGFFDRFL